MKRIVLVVTLLAIGLAGVGIGIFVVPRVQKSLSPGITPSPNTSSTLVQKTATVPPTSNTQVKSNVSVSPLLFGTNLSLYDSNDQFLTSATTRSTLQRLHTHIIRMPIRDNAPEALNVRAAQTIKSMGAVPLIILHGPADADSLSVGTQVINDMNQLFGDQLVYYEVGNENDLQGVSAQRYVNGWNNVVPQFKRLARNAQFIGPVNYQYDHAYLSTFLQSANPAPDAISWHEYTCDASAAAETCIAHIQKWTEHIQDANALMTQIAGKALPIMITEWNYSPNPSARDGKSSDSAFMQTWTITALHTLAVNHVFASMQYACTHGAMPLVTKAGDLAPQGEGFQTAYQQIAMGTQ